MMASTYCAIGISHDAAIQAEFDTVLNILAGTWKWKDCEKQFKELKGKHAGLSEIKFKVGKEKFRPIGFVLNQPHRNNSGQLMQGKFGIILGCHKSGRIYMPLNAFDSALEIKRQYIEKRRGSFHELDF